MKKILIVISILVILYLLLIPVNADEPKNMNIQITEYPEKTLTISQSFEMSANVPKSDYYKCLDVCFCDDSPDMDEKQCKDICKIWCYNTYVK
jgi:hypothetical protein